MTEITDGIKMDSQVENTPNQDPDNATPEFIKAQMKQIKDAMKSMYDSKYGEIFRIPVDPERDNVPNYFEIIKTPIDLGTILKKLEDSEYQTASEVVTDFNLMINNCLTYNPDGTFAHHQAKELERLFSKRMARLPQVFTSSLPLKRKNSSRKPEEVSELKESKDYKDSKELRAKPKVKKTSSPTAQNDSNLNLDQSIAFESILRQSQRDRGCRRTTQRDVYEDDKNSNNSGGWQNFCQHVIGELCGKKHQDVSRHFMIPVDPIALNIPDYFDVVKFPMDLGTIRSRLKGTYYTNAKQVVRDVRLVFSNCYRFNSPETDVYKCAVSLQNAFEMLLAAAPIDLFQELLVGQEDTASEILSVEAVRTTRRSHLYENKQFADFCHGVEKKLQTIVDEINKIKSDRSNRSGGSHGENGQYILKKTTRANHFNLTPLKTISTPPIIPKAEPQKVEDCDPMTYDEKLALSSQIMCLSEQKIKEIVSLINQREPWSRKISQSKEKETVEVDLNSLQPATLRAIEKYITTVTKRKSENIMRKKCTAEERVTREQQLRSKLHIMESQLAGTVPIPIGSRNQTKSTDEAEKIQEAASRLSESSESEISDDEFSRRYSLNKQTTTTGQSTNLIKRPTSKEIPNGNLLTAHSTRPTTSFTLPSKHIPSSGSVLKPNNNAFEKIPGSSSFMTQLIGEKTASPGKNAKPQTPTKLSSSNINNDINSQQNDVESGIVQQKANICETKT